MEQKYKCPYALQELGVGLWTGKFLMKAWELRMQYSIFEFNRRQVSVIAITDYPP
jgi:hypothetical protein